MNEKCQVLVIWFCVFFQFFSPVTTFWPCPTFWPQQEIIFFVCHHCQQLECMRKNTFYKLFYKLFEKFVKKKFVKIFTTNFFLYSLLNFQKVCNSKIKPKNTTKYLNYQCLNLYFENNLYYEVEKGSQKIILGSQFLLMKKTSMKINWRINKLINK